MAEVTEIFVRRELRSPRSAAIAGVIFSLLMITSMILISAVSAATIADINRDWIQARAATTKLAIQLVPFAGIAFLWFTGVIRDHLGEKEDQFFATIFFGSGVVFVALIFIWAAIIGTLLGVHFVATNLLVDNDIYIFGFTFMKEIIGTYAMRMAGVYMISVGTIWTRTGAMPRWLSIITFIVALGFLLFASTIRVARFIFPGWVFLVSAYVLIANYRLDGGRSVEQQSRKG